MNEDIEIIDKILKGDLTYFNKLLDKYEKMVYNLAYKMFLNNLDAEDITQEVFIKVYKNIEKCNKNISLKNWIYTITYNSCIDEIRKRKGKNNTSIDAMVQTEDNEYKIEIASNTKTPEEELLQKETLNNIEIALNKLNYDARVLIYLRDIKGLAYTEISEILNINIGTVKSRLNRARNALKKLLEF